MKAIIFSIALFLSSNIFGQEVVLETNFAVRDFKIKDSTLVYIEKRAIKSYNIITKKADTLFPNNSFFIGGYGLNIFYPKDTNQIITASNELVRNFSAIRFYDLQKKEVNKYEVYYPTKLMDFLVIPEEHLFFLSKKDSTIEIFKYGKKPRYKKTNVIPLDSYARKIRYYNNKLYYVTDTGKVFEYSIKENINKLIYASEYLLVNFVFDSSNEIIYTTTFDGKVIKVNINDSSKNRELTIGNEIIEAIAIVGDVYLVVGDWGGKISVINLNEFAIERQYENEKRIIKIRTSEENIFYTSGADNTIRKWKIK